MCAVSETMRPDENVEKQIQGGWSEIVNRIGAVTNCGDGELVNDRTLSDRNSKQDSDRGAGERLHSVWFDQTESPGQNLKLKVTGDEGCIKGLGN